MQLGAEPQEFTLPATDGAEHSFPAANAGPTVVVFTCNHCPYALAWQDRISAVASDYGDRASFFAVNPNNAETHPGDSFDAMKQRVDSEGGWPLPYLRDESQEVASAYGAKTTPDVFVFDADGRLRYRGAPDADHRDPTLNAAYLRDALDAVLAGEEPATPESEPVGCSIKWK
jgi:peroxiredoxin